MPLRLLLALFFLASAPLWGQSAIKDGDRIVFIGDSITGQGAKGGKGGWMALIGEGLSLTRPEAKPTLIGLGGSGATVGAWLNFEKRSRTGPLVLDVPGVDVGQTLDAGAEIVVVMLGMNDVLSPSLKNEAADFDAWIGRYRELIEAIRARCHPRVIAVATITPCTEDVASPKNLVLSELNHRLEKLAQEQDFRLLPTSLAALQVQRLGRTHQPYFRVTGDFVHPNAAGHLAIAHGMLNGLGEGAAAKKLLFEQHAALFRPGADKFPTLSYRLTRMSSAPEAEKHQFLIHYEWESSDEGSAPLVKVAVPQGWQASPESLRAPNGEFMLSGPLERAETTITMSATAGSITREQRITLPAGWRIAVGSGQGLGWTQNTNYDPAKDRQPLDETLARGEGLTEPVPFPAGKPGTWDLYVPSRDYTGLDRPGSVDLAAVVFFRYHQQAYGARWVHSERERPVSLNLSSQSFAGVYSLGVWLNGQRAYEGKLMGEPGRKAAVETTLRRGWNLLVFKSTFIAWQWQFSIDLAGQEGDDLSDLRYATRPPPAKAP